MRQPAIIKHAPVDTAAFSTSWGRHQPTFCQIHPRRSRAQHAGRLGAPSRVRQVKVGWRPPAGPMRLSNTLCKPDVQVLGTTELTATVGGPGEVKSSVPGLAPMALAQTGERGPIRVTTA